MQDIQRWLLTLIGLALLGGIQQQPWRHPSSTARLRLSWRTNGQEIKIPRLQDPNLPAHMRLPEGQAFDIKIRPYRLILRVDGQTLLERRVEAAGIRHDRPLSVFEELAIPPGPHDLEVHFFPDDLSQDDQPFRARWTFGPGRVRLIGLDSEQNWRTLP